MADLQGDTYDAARAVLERLDKIEQWSTETLEDAIEQQQEAVRAVDEYKRTRDAYQNTHMSRLVDAAFSSGTTIQEQRRITDDGIKEAKERYKSRITPLAEQTQGFADAPVNLYQTVIHGAPAPVFVPSGNYGSAPHTTTHQQSRNRDEVNTRSHPRSHPTGPDTHTDTDPSVGDDTSPDTDTQNTTTDTPLENTDRSGGGWAHTHPNQQTNNNHNGGQQQGTPTSAYSNRNNNGVGENGRETMTDEELQSLLDAHTSGANIGSVADLAGIPAASFMGGYTSTGTPTTTGGGVGLGGYTNTPTTGTNTSSGGGRGVSIAQPKQTPTGRTPFMPMAPTGNTNNTNKNTANRQGTLDEDLTQHVATSLGLTNKNQQHQQ